MNQIAQAPYKSHLAYQAGLLGGVTALAALLLAGAHLLTRDSIALRQREDLGRSLAQVVPADRHDNNLATSLMRIKTDAGQEVPVYRALRGREVTGAAFQVAGRGYAGTIEILMGLDPQGRITGVRVLAHAETPGLGDKIEADKGPWIHGFEGRHLGDPPEERWGVKKDGGEFDQFSGATITPRAVVAAIREGLQLFARHRDQILAPPAGASSHVQGE